MKSEDLAVGIPATILLIGHILLCIYLITIILLRRSLRDQVTHWFILNTVICHLLFSLIIRPGSLEYEYHHVGVAQVYCRVFFIMSNIEQVMVPALLLMYTVDRMMYVRNPDTYGQKMSLGVVLVLLLLPWGLSILVGVVASFGYAGDRLVASIQYGSNSTPVACGNEHTVFHTGMLIFHAILALLVALASLIVTVLVMCFFFRYKRAVSFSQAYSQLDAEVLTYVKDATLVVCILNVLFLLVFVTNFLLVEFVAGHLISSDSVYFLFELFQGICFLFLSTDIRRESNHLCCKRNRQESETNEETTLRYVASAEEAQ